MGSTPLTPPGTITVRVPAVGIATAIAVSETGKTVFSIQLAESPTEVTFEVLRQLAIQGIDPDADDPELATRLAVTLDAANR